MDRTAPDGGNTCNNSDGCTIRKNAEASYHQRTKDGSVYLRVSDGCIVQPSEDNITWFEDGCVPINSDGCVDRTPDVCVAQTIRRKRRYHL